MSNPSTRICEARTSTQPYCKIIIAYRLREVLEQANHGSLSTGPRISGPSLLSLLIRLTLIVLLFIEGGAIFVFCGQLVPPTDRNPIVHQLSASRVRDTGGVRFVHIENGNGPITQ